MKSGRPTRSGKYGIEFVQTSPMRPATMGKTERFFQQLNPQLIRHLPGYRGKRRTDQQADETEKLLSLEQLQSEIVRFIERHNNEQDSK